VSSFKIKKPLLWGGYLFPRYRSAFVG